MRRIRKTLKIGGFLKIYHTDEVGMINMQLTVIAVVHD